MKPIFLFTITWLLMITPHVYAATEWEDYTPLEVTLFETASDQQAQMANKPGPLLSIAAPSDLLEQIKKELESPFGRFIRQLDKMSRSYLQIEQGCEAFRHQTLLYLSNEDGGFARQGFWFKSKQDKPEYCDLLFVDMTVTINDINQGRFLEVFAHEMAHIFMRRLKGNLPPSPSTRFHNVFAVTDYQTAFNEGFGIYFQTFAAVMSDHQGFRARMEGRTPPTGAEHWFSNIDGRERIFGVMHNNFVFERALPERLTAIDAYRLEGLLPSHSTQLKNAQSMLASEGVIATLFYRLVTNPDIFAIDPRDTHWQSASLATHREIFDSLAHHSWQSTSQPYLQFVSSLTQNNKAKAKQILKSFITTTYGSSMEKSATALAQRMIHAGYSGHLEQFVQHYAEYKRKIAQLAEIAIKDSTRLSQEIGTAIWLTQPGVQVKTAPWADKRQPLTVNLNAATKAELQLLGMFSEKQISDFLNNRSIHGPYADLTDIKNRLRWSEELLVKIANQIKNFK